ncbi:SRPBCC family protein [Streptomyces sp. NPDC005727]|uniref:SRPBCC family protein n=1 Tax=Streptomyces sp. NPDC005727 TaxID=3157053 RepID=UPI0033E000AE
MGRLTLRATGPARPEAVLRRYACVDQWASSPPQIRAVHTAGRRLTAGMSGTVESVVGLRVAFVVDSVDDDHRTWTWRVRLGAAGLRLRHDVRGHAHGSTTSLTMHGPWLVVLGYAPLARLALRRLVRP